MDPWAKKPRFAKISAKVLIIGQKNSAWWLMPELSIPKLKVAILLPGATAVSDGACDNWKGTLRTEEGHDCVAYVKMLPNNQTYTEVISALLAHALTLPMPSVYLVQVEKSVLPDSKEWGPSESKRYAFATEDVRQPSFAQFVRSDNTMMSKLKSWTYFHKTAVFDEWIANKDRHNGNLLYAGNGEFWLIDHSHALTGPKWDPRTITADSLKAVANQLIDATGPHTAEEKKDFELEAERESIRYSKISLKTISTDDVISKVFDATTTDAVQTFMTKRASAVIDLICNRIGTPRLL